MSGVNGRVIADFYTAAFDVLDLCLNHLAWKTKFRDCYSQHPSCHRLALKHSYPISHFGQKVSTG
ncbi:hypothetical protein ES703_105365 [subsurface metagenome]